MKPIKKVMLIDDDEINNFIVIKNIKAIQFAEEATYHLRAEEGLNELKRLAENNPEELPNVIFLDINMPKMNGWAFLKEYDEILKATDKKIILFMLSSSIYRQDMLKAEEHSSVAEYILKPLNQEKLKNIYSKHLGGETQA